LLGCSLLHVCTRTYMYVVLCYVVRFYSYSAGLNYYQLAVDTLLFS